MMIGANVFSSKVGNRITKHAVPTQFVPPVAGFQFAQPKNVEAVGVGVGDGAEVGVGVGLGVFDGAADWGACDAGPAIATDGAAAAALAEAEIGAVVSLATLPVFGARNAE